MNDIVQINADNQRRIDAAWKPTPEHPHAVVTYDGLHVVAINPAISKAWADDRAASINAEGKVGVHAQVL